MNNFAICLLDENQVANIILNNVVKRITKELPKSNVSIFTSSHGNFNVDCGVFCLAELWFFTGEVFVFDANTLQFVKNLKQNTKINFVFFNQSIDIVPLMRLLDDDVLNICLDKSSADNFIRLTGRPFIDIEQYIKLHKTIGDNNE